MKMSSKISRLSPNTRSAQGLLRSLRNFMFCHSGHGNGCMQDINKNKGIKEDKMCMEVSTKTYMSIKNETWLSSEYSFIATEAFLGRK